MTHLDATDPLRYSLTQWHKSFGIAVLLLALFRIVWRLTHKPPALPDGTHGFERVASAVTHLLLYLLMVMIPLTGWVMVSASPLNLETLLFGVITWPHISFVAEMTAREQIAEQFANAHLWLGNLTILLVLLHTSAALFHQWVHRDHLLSRMVISDSHRRAGDLKHGLVAGVLLAAGGGLFLVSLVTESSGSPSTGQSVAGAAESSVASDTETRESSVGFTAMQSGSPLEADFTEATVELMIDQQAPDTSTLTAVVMTASVKSDDAQLDATMVTADWFASSEFPQATFNSTGFSRVSDNQYQVTGELTIRQNTQVISFDLMLEGGVGSGEFVINRGDFEVGDGGQDEFVDPEVVIRFAVTAQGL